MNEIMKVTGSCYCLQPPGPLNLQTWQCSPHCSHSLDIGIGLQPMTDKCKIKSRIIYG